ncbi:MAG TPA: ribbon-helix-helix protein, CopG family [Rhizomicrobium sp.]
MQRERYSVRLPANLLKQLDELALRKRVGRAAIVETALASYLSPDGADQLETALARRLDRINRQLDRMERHIAITNETLALFIRTWLIQTPPLPDAAQAAAQAKGRQRYEAFVEAVGRRLARGKSLIDEITREAAADPNKQTLE